MGTKPLVCSWLLVGTLVVVTGSSGCWNCGPQKQKQKTPFNPNTTTGMNGTTNAPPNYRNLPTGTQGQDPTVQAGQTPIDPTGRPSWGQGTPGSPGLTGPGSPPAPSASVAPVAPLSPATNTTHYVPGVNPLATQAQESSPSPGKQTVQYGNPLPSPPAPELPSRTEETVRPLPPSTVLSTIDEPRSHTGLSRPVPIPPPPSDTSLSPVSGPAPSLPRFSSPAVEPQPSDPMLAAPPPTVNKLPPPLPPLPPG